MRTKGIVHYLHDARNICVFNYPLLVRYLIEVPDVINILLNGTVG